MRDGFNCYSITDARCPTINTLIPASQPLALRTLTSYTMATTKVQLSDLPQFRGTFSWDEDNLIANIKASKADYDQLDPATWPRMTTARLEAQLGSLSSMDKDLDNLPLGLAYDNEIAQIFGAQNPHYIGVEVREPQHRYGRKCMNFRHYLFPYFYGPTGYTYKAAGSGLSSNIRTQWIARVTGAYPKKATVAAAEATTPGRRRIYSVDSSNSESEVGRDSPAPPTSATQAYREVLDMIDRCRSTELADLQEQVDRLKRVPATQTQTSVDAVAAFEKHMQAEKDRVVALEQALADKERELADRDSELEDKNDELTHKEAQIRHKDAELQRSQKETDEARHQVIDIWTQMKAASRQGGKRAADASACVPRVAKRKKERAIEHAG